MRHRHDDLRAPGKIGRSAVQEAVLRFTVWSAIALLVLGFGALLVSQHIAQDEAVRDARERGDGIAHGVAGPMVDSDVRAGLPSAVARLANVMENRMRDGSVSHIRLWAEDGRVIWSDETDLIGRQFKLPPKVAALFGTHDDVTEVAPLDEAASVAQQDRSPLLEVFVGTRDANGLPMVFEAYVPPQRLDEDRVAILTELVPLALGALLVFQLTMFPLAVSLARRVQRGQEERADILRRALLSSDLERRRIAQDLHDGVIQDLAGLSYALPSVVGQLRDGPSADRARKTAAQMSTILQRDVSALRTLLTDIYPPDLEGEGLALALNELATGASEADVAVEVDLEPGLDVPADTARLVYRVVREGLRNVVRHAGAARAQVMVRSQGEDLTVRVADDGRGLAPVNGEERGHLGVKLLADTVGDMGGRLDLRTGTGGGAVLEASFPASLPR